ncbi:TPA: ParA family protein [Enterococcus faecalis]
MKKATVLSFPMQKGGVGKTTTSKNVTEILGVTSKVLAVDNDQNADFTDTFTSKKVLEQSGVPTLYDVYIKNLDINDVKIKITENIDLVPSSIMLANVDIELTARMSREFVLKKAIEKVIYDYDFIIIDCSPSLNMTTINALVASDYTIYVTQLEYFSMQGLEQLQKTVDMVKEINPTLTDLGLILTMADGTNHVKDVLDELSASSYNLLGTIDRATLVRDSIMSKQAVFQFDQNHKVAKQYQAFVNTLLQLMEDK